MQVISPKFRAAIRTAISESGERQYSFAFRKGFRPEQFRGF